jgi:hypothetical protein
LAGTEEDRQSLTVRVFHIISISLSVLTLFLGETFANNPTMIKFIRKKIMKVEEEIPWK